MTIIIITTAICRPTYHFPGFAVRLGAVGPVGAHGVVIVLVLGERQPVGDVEVRLERVIHVVVQPAPYAVHRVPGTVALADQVVPEAVASGCRNER